ncbi:hypothetical protein [Gordonia sp. KTR9]|uniref:hypothetical protein n=1 Tax=Gordonia sp. KTR9 TaxID=337191 RepID=UPI00027DE4CF|nr:hypothetical protein [Gordonia sp. KTR9]AFR49741.1 hypothetical protein KTR9_3106 [Gordonia sp. KTR9]
MNRLPAIAHRLSVGLVAVLLIVVGAAAMAWRVGIEPVAGWVERLDERAALDAAQASWWIWALAGLTVIAVGWGLLLLATNIRPRAVDDAVLDGSDQTGTLTVAPKLIANAAAAELAGNPLFQKATAKAIDDRSRSIIRLEVSARPTRRFDEVTAPVADTVTAIRTALGDSGVHVQAFVHLDR